MPMVCTICNHPHRLEIDRKLAQGKSYTGIARQYGLSEDAVRRHSQKHLSRQLAAAFDRKNLAENMDLLSKIEGIITKAEDIFDRNFALKRDHLALKALSEQRNTIDLLSRIAIQLHEIRSMELQSREGSYSARRRAEEQEMVDLIFERLNPAEIRLLAALQRKLHGERNKDVVPPPPDGEWQEPEYGLETITACLAEFEGFEGRDAPAPEPDSTPLRRGEKSRRVDNPFH